MVNSFVCNSFFGTNFNTGKFKTKFVYIHWNDTLCVRANVVNYHDRIVQII